jgi:hypothetical protein
MESLRSRVALVWRRDASGERGLGFRGLGSKSGKAPLAKFGNAQMAWTGPGVLTVFSAKGKTEGSASVH